MMQMRTIIMAGAVALAACGQAPTETQEEAAPIADSTDLTTWDRGLLALLPQIDRCIADAGGPQQVSFAGDHEGVTLVRLQGSEQSVDCRVTASARDGGLVANLRPRDEALVVQGEGAAVFVRGPGANPGGECYEAPEVRDANGALLGWMLDPEGC